MLSLSGKVALVTGASGGIGGAIAKALHQQGAFVVISGTNQVALDALAAELKERVTVQVCNLQEELAVMSLIDAVCDKHERIDILVCNAGVTKDNLALRMSMEDFDTVMNLNLRSTFILNKAAIKRMIKQKTGRVINISSIVAFTGNAGQANYTAAKAGMVAMSKTFAQEVASRGVTVNCVAPGFIATPMTDNLKEEHKEKLLASIPCGRLGSSQDIASAVVFLASDEASYITGQTIHVNGGMAML